jgi:signal transduction histidine kinase
MGFEPSELVARPIRQLALDDQAALPPAAAPEGARFELHLKTKAGCAVPYDIHCRPIAYLGELCYLWVARDITPTQQLQECLIRSERLAITGQLAAFIAHEINSPLQGITALLNVLGSAYDRDEYLQEKLKLIDGAFNKIRDTVRNLIDLNPDFQSRK